MSVEPERQKFIVEFWVMCGLAGAAFGLMVGLVALEDGRALIWLIVSMIFGFRAGYLSRRARL